MSGISLNIPTGINDAHLLAMSQSQSQSGKEDCTSSLFEPFSSVLQAYTLLVVEKDLESLVDGERLEAGRERVDTLRALSSSVYLCVTWEDPIHVAFRLIERADQLALNDPIFRVCNELPVAIFVASCTDFTKISFGLK